MNCQAIVRNSVCKNYSTAIFIPTHTAMPLPCCYHCCANNGSRPQQYLISGSLMVTYIYIYIHLVQHMTFKEATCSGHRIYCPKRNLIGSLYYFKRTTVDQLINFTYLRSKQEQEQVGSTHLASASSYFWCSRAPFKLCVRLNYLPVFLSLLLTSPIHRLQLRLCCHQPY